MGGNPAMLTGLTCGSRFGEQSGAGNAVGLVYIARHPLKLWSLA